jgi:plasmid stabilization system protein ParE
MSCARNIEYLVEFTERATLDLDAIYEYIGATGSSAASSWFNRLEELIAVDHEARRVLVVHIRHGARKAFRREDLH